MVTINRDLFHAYEIDIELKYWQVMHIAAAVEMNSKFIPSLRQLHSILEAKRNEFKDIVKTGRTHTQDAMPSALSGLFG